MGHGRRQPAHHRRSALRLLIRGTFALCESGRESVLRDAVCPAGRTVSVCPAAKRR